MTKECEELFSNFDINLNPSYEKLWDSICVHVSPQYRQKLLEKIEVERNNEQKNYIKTHGDTRGFDGSKFETKKANWDGKHLWEFCNFKKGSNKEQDQKHEDFKSLLPKKPSYSTVNKMGADGIKKDYLIALVKASSSLQNFSSLVEFIDNYVLNCISKKIDNQIVGFKYYDEYSEVFKTFNLIENIIKQSNWHNEKRTKYSLRLGVPEFNEDISINNYASETIEIIGRDQEKKQLLAFLEHKREVSWFQLAGVAGQGKSRLGLWLIHKAKSLNWNAGFLDADTMLEMESKWSSWQPEVPHLIILDYVIGRTKEIGRLIRTLVMRSDNLKYNIKILLLERQACYSENKYKIQEENSNSYKEINAFNSKAPWFIEMTGHYDANVPAFYKTRYKNGFLTLGKLSDEALLSIVNKIHTKISNDVFNFSDKEILKKLKRIDADGRPLYAYFFTQEIVFNRDSSEWSRESLLKNILMREIEYWWKAEFKSFEPFIGSDMPANKLALLATMTGEINCCKAEEIGVIPYTNHQVRRESTVLNGGALSSKSSADSHSSKIIKSMQPDLLGEWFVLSNLIENPSLKSLLNLAIKYTIDGATTFIIHTLQDFSDYVYGYGILDDIDYDLIDLESLNKLLKITIEFKNVPQKLINNAIKRLDTSSDDSQHADFHYNLGVCYEFGYGVEKNNPQSKLHFNLGAASKSASAMYEVAEKYIDGDNEQKKIAFKLYKESAEKGHDSSAYKLALCYQLGDGTQVSEDDALLWHKKATEFGHADSMYFVGKKYENNREYSRAFYWYTVSAKGYYLPAMAALASCYEDSKGVAKNYKKSYYWHREVLSHRDWIFWRGDTFLEHLALTQYKLGYYYENGLGVPIRKEKAFYLYREAAIGGGKLAMHAVARCYEQGIGVRSHKIKSKYWYDEACKK